MVGSVVPIVIGYAIAHYATLLVVEGQRTAINGSDPLGRGWNVFGSAEMGVNSAIFNHPACSASLPRTSWRSGTCPQPGRWPASSMLGVMIGYTCAGLVLLFSP